MSVEITRVLTSAAITRNALHLVGGDPAADERSTPVAADDGGNITRGWSGPRGRRCIYLPPSFRGTRRGH